METSTTLSNNTFDHMIVWLDQNIASTGCYQQLKRAFATTVNPENYILTTIDEVDIPNLIQDQATQRDTCFLEVPFTFKLFADIQSCLNFLLANAGKKRIFFMTSGQLGKDIVRQLLTDHKHVFTDMNGKFYEDSIYIFCADAAKHAEWAFDFLDLGCYQNGD